MLGISKTSATIEVEIIRAKVGVKVKMMIVWLIIMNIWGIRIRSI